MHPYSLWMKDCAYLNLTLITSWSLNTFQLLFLLLRLQDLPNHHHHSHKLHPGHQLAHHLHYGDQINLGHVLNLMWWGLLFSCPCPHGAHCQVSQRVWRYRVLGLLKCRPRLGDLRKLSLASWLDPAKRYGHFGLVASGLPCCGARMAWRARFLCGSWVVVGWSCPAG